MGSSEKSWTTELQIRMDCNGCVQKIRRSLSGIEGVKEVNIDLSRQKVKVVGKASPEKMVKVMKKMRRVATIGSHIENIDADSTPTVEPIVADPPPPPPVEEPPKEEPASVDTPPPPTEEPPKEESEPSPPESEEKPAPPPESEEKSTPPPESEEKPAPPPESEEKTTPPPNEKPRETKEVVVPMVHHYPYNYYYNEMLHHEQFQHPYYHHPDVAATPNTIRSYSNHQLSPPVTFQYYDHRQQQQFYRRGEGSSIGGGNTMISPSIFSEEDPNACTIV